MKQKSHTFSLLFLLPSSVFAEVVVLPTVTIEANLIPEFNQQKENPQNYSPLHGDGGEYLHNLNGVSGSRMGGHGIDPIIRGQAQNRLNILLDGAYVHGACPNRMDPPTAYAAPKSYDKVTVIKGSQTVVYGAGGSGGTVLFERTPPKVTADKPMTGNVSAGYSGNNQAKNVHADIATGDEKAYVRGIVDYQKSENYKDGAGKEVRSASTMKTGYLIAGYTPDKNTEFNLTLSKSKENDVLYAGAGMDAPESEHELVKLRYKGVASLAEFYYSNVDHVMDNYSLRPVAAGAMRMRSPSNSKTYGGRVYHQFDLNETSTWLMGADFQHNNRNADRLAGMPTMGTPSNLQSLLWADVTIQQVGLFSELGFDLSDSDYLKLGLRYDRVSSEAANAQQKVMKVSPNDLFTKYYGKQADKKDENNISGLAYLEHDINDNFSLFGSVSRTVRSADATERYLAANNSNSMMVWVGNPDIKAEKHHQLDIGVQWHFAQQNHQFSTFYNRVSDYILRDRAHGQAGILQADNASIYRNVDARLWGVEWESQFTLSDRWSTQFSLAYVNGENTTDGRALAQMPPLTGQWAIQYQHDNWHLRSTLHFASKQTRVDDNKKTGSGLDAGETAGYGVIDLAGDYRVNKNTVVSLGVRNIFDKTYAYHVNRANADPFNPEATRVNEIGRSVWLNLSATF